MLSTLYRSYDRDSTKPVHRASLSERKLNTSIKSQEIATMATVQSIGPNFHSFQRNHARTSKSPMVLSFHGSRRVGKTTFMKSFLDHCITAEKKPGFFTRTYGNGPFFLRHRKHQAAFFCIEASSDSLSMINLVKSSDVLVLLIDGYFGLELETFELFSLILAHHTSQAHSPRMVCALTHLDLFRHWKSLKKAKKRIKRRIIQEIGMLAKILCFSGLTLSETYFSREIANFTRYLSHLAIESGFFETPRTPYILVSALILDRTQKKKAQSEPHDGSKASALASLPIVNELSPTQPTSNSSLWQPSRRLHESVYLLGFYRGPPMTDHPEWSVPLTRASCPTNQIFHSQHSLSRKSLFSTLSVFPWSSAYIPGIGKVRIKPTQSARSSSATPSSAPVTFSYTSYGPEPNSLCQIKSSFFRRREGTSSRSEKRTCLAAIVEKNKVSRFHVNLVSRNGYSTPEFFFRISGYVWYVYGWFQFSLSKKATSPANDILDSFSIPTCLRRRYNVNQVKQELLSDSHKFYKLDEDALKYEEKHSKMIASCIIGARCAWQEEPVQGCHKNVSVADPTALSKHSIEAVERKLPSVYPSLACDPKPNHRREAENRCFPMQATLSSDGFSNISFFSECAIVPTTPTKTVPFLHAAQAKDLHEPTFFSQKKRFSSKFPDKRYPELRSTSQSLSRNQPSLSIWRVELENLPQVFGRYFDPTYLLVLDLSRIQVNTVSHPYQILEARITPAKWTHRRFFSDEPYLLSLGWQIFKTILIFFTQTKPTCRRQYRKWVHGQHRQAAGTMWTLFRTPFCYELGTVLVGIHTSFVARSTFSGSSKSKVKPAGFCLGTHGNILFTGSVVKNTTSTKNTWCSVRRKHQLQGIVAEKRQQTVYVKHMFSRETEVTRFIGAHLHSGTGIRGKLQYALRAGNIQTRGKAMLPPGSFRARFEKNLALGEKVFLRFWMPVTIPTCLSTYRFFTRAYDVRDIGRKIKALL